VKRSLGVEGLKKVLPRGARALLGRTRRKIEKARRESLPKLGEEEFASLLRDELRIAPGDLVLVHSSADGLRVSFPLSRLLGLLREAAGAEGTLVFPTYPRLASYEFLSRGEVFDVRRTPSYMGMLTELARRQRDAVRSLHPTKSVCALGRLAREITAEHHLSPYPFGRTSPYFKIVERGGKSVGLGVSTERMSLIHCVEDALGGEFPVRTSHARLFAARCVDYEGREVTVETYAHDLSKMNHRIPRYVRARVPPEVCRDLKLGGVRFFRADAARLFDVMLADARRGVTVYPRSAYARTPPPSTSSP
jgi:aminoglycoside 3-N-acetyltransferase